MSCPECNELEKEIENYIRVLRKIETQVAIIERSYYENDLPIEEIKEINTIIQEVL